MKRYSNTDTGIRIKGSVQMNSLPLRLNKPNLLVISSMIICAQVMLFCIRRFINALKITVILALSCTTVYAKQCPDGSITVDNFPAYKSDLTNNQLLAISDVSRDILKSGYKKWYVDGHGAVFGSRAKKGSSETQAISLDRANIVMDVLKFAMDDSVSGSSIGFDFIPRSFGNLSPVTTNKTKAGRAKNRRVVLCVRTVPQIIVTPKGKDPELKLDEGLVELRKDPTANAITTCLIDRLKDSTKDHDYLSSSQLAIWHDTDISKLEASSPQFFVLDLKEKLKHRVSRINRVPTSESPLVRFKSAFENEQKNLINGIRDVNNLNCYDPQRRRAKGRRYFRQQSMNKDSLYSCREIKRHVESAVRPGDSIHKCEGS